MADAGRKDFTSQAKDTLTPESQKSTLDQANDSVTGTADHAASALQPEQNKSSTQKIGDSVRGTSDDASSQGKGFVESAQDSLNSAAQSVSDTFSGGKK